MAIDCGRIVAVGDSESIRGLADANTRMVDLAGKTLLPGLIDSHVHLFLTGLGLSAVALQGATSVGDVCDAIRERARATPPGRWVYGMGCAPWALKEARYPLLSELDEAAPDNPVYISAVTFHSGATNTRGLSRDWPCRRGARRREERLRAYRQEHSSAMMRTSPPRELRSARFPEMRSMRCTAGPRASRPVVA